MPNPVENISTYLQKDKSDESIMRIESKEIASELLELTFGRPF